MIKRKTQNQEKEKKNLKQNNNTMDNKTYNIDNVFFLKCKLFILDSKCDQKEKYIFEFGMKNKNCML